MEYREDWTELISAENGISDPGIPHNPDFIYRHTGWKSWKDWLVPPGRNMVYTPFFEAREFVRSLRLADEQSWNQYIHSETPLHKSYGLDLPGRPFLEYKGKGWVDWADWLGSIIQFRSYGQTRKFIHSLQLKSKKEWDAYCMGKLTRPLIKPKVIYRYPEVAYQGDGWISWVDWLGCG